MTSAYQHGIFTDPEMGNYIFTIMIVNVLMISMYTVYMSYLCHFTLLLAILKCKYSTKKDRRILFYFYFKI
jgi:hypothetical protein